MKNKFAIIFLIILGLYVLIHLSVTSIMDLTNTTDVHTVTLDGAFEVLELEHSINGLIPIGTDYYYLGINEDTYDAYLIKSSKKWLKTNFGSDYTALNPNGVQATGLAKEISDFELSRELETRLSQVEGVNYPLGQMYCLHLQYEFDAIFSLIVVVLAIFVIITGIYIFKIKNSVEPVFVTLWTVVMLIALVLLLIVMT